MTVKKTGEEKERKSPFPGGGHQRNNKLVGKRGFPNPKGERKARKMDVSGK